MRLSVFALVLLANMITGCRVFQAVGDRTHGLMNRMASSGASRRSALDELESEEPEYLLDTVFKKNRGVGDERQRFGSQNQDRARKLFSEGEQLYQKAVTTQKDNPKRLIHQPIFAKAGKKFEQAGDFYINSTLEQEALFRAGESYFFADHLKKASDVYEKLMKEYQGTRFSDIVQARRFAIAEYWLAISKQNPQNPLVLNFGNNRRPLRDTAGNAIRVLNRMRIDGASGKMADDATLLLANAYFEQGRFLDAADTYKDLRINFPKSEHQFHAHLFEMKSRLQAYQGPHYDGTHLELAEKLAKALRSQFPEKASKHQELITTESARIRKLMAERQVAMAQYYENRGAYQAAGMHYQQIASEFPSTPAAQKAETRLTKISEKPAKSNEPPAWVAWMFPESKPADPIFGTSLKSQIR